MKKLLVTLLFAAVAATAPAAMLITNPGINTVRNNNSYTVGLRFIVGSSDLSVTALGILNIDSSGNAKAGGLLLAHSVALWDSAGTLLASTTLAAGSGNGSTVWAWNSITPLTLTANQTYTLGAQYPFGNTDYLREASTTPTFSPDITSPTARYASNTGTLIYPVNSPAGGAYVGPNLQYATVPEPAAWMLLVGGLAVVMVFRHPGFLNSWAYPNSVRTPLKTDPC